MVAVVVEVVGERVVRKRQEGDFHIYLLKFKYGQRAIKSNTNKVYERCFPFISKFYCLP